MRKPVVDYRSFRFRRIKEPQYRHLWLLLGWVVYLAMFVLTERLIPAERCHVIHCALDDRIPFREIFLIPYVFWYFLVAGSEVYFALYHIESFRKLNTYIIITQVIAMAVYILFPNRQDLRPVVFPRDNLLTRGVGLLYAVDTNTGVCPSLHVAYSLALVSVWTKYRETGAFRKGFVVVWAVLICLSTLYIKQHSVVDVLAAAAVCLVAEAITYGLPRRSWFPKPAG